MIKRYTRKFKEEENNSLSLLTDVDLVDKIYNYFYNNPFPLDHEGIHKFAESLGQEPEIIEQYIYAMLSTFICGGKAYKENKQEIDFDPKAIEQGMQIETEHLAVDIDNPVIKKIVELFSKRISLDHLTESFPLNYYDYLKQTEKQIEADKKK